MSRAALCRQEANVKERQRQADEAFQNALLEGSQRSQNGLIPLKDTTTFNLNPMLLNNVSKSPYFVKKCVEIEDWTGLVDEIYYQVKHVEPWTLGAAKTPSTAFALLLRLFTLRCTEKQMKIMLDHVDSPYIRCIGFLYLRYAADPSILWEWFKPYLYDRETVKIRANVKCGEATVGNFVRDLLTELDYYGTRLPRFPVAVEREIRGKLKEEAIIEQRANRHMEDREALRYLERVGSKVQALYGDAENPVTWYNAVVDRVLKKDDATGVEFYRPKFVVTFFEYGNTETVTLGQMDMPGVDHSKPSPVGHDRHGSAARSMGHEDRDGSHSDRGRDCDRGYDRDFRDRPRDDLRNRSGGNRSNQRYASSSQGYGHDDRSHDRDRNSNRGYTDRQDYRRDKKQHRERSRSRDREPKETQARPPPKKTPEELAAIAQKKRKLLVKYG